MIEISDEDVANVASQLGLSLEPASTVFLKRVASCDVHACPGSGKTTLLVAKLALLARNWRWRDRGILVLSHTNVARQEIEARLSHNAVATRLFAYPHFIGTIQGFVDRFLAFPYLRDVGVKDVLVSEPRVDDDEFARRAWNWFGSGGWKHFKTARGYLRNKRPHDQGRGIIERLSYVKAGLELDIGGVAGSTTATAQELRTLKDGLSAQGLFRYRDMFAFAWASVDRHPFLADALRYRFPWVFIDEVQDTATDHESLIDRLFASGCVLQKLGDRNQGIFRGEGDDEITATTPLDALDLPISHRLAPNIAKFASPLTCVRPQVLTGNASRKDRKHTVFLFSDEQLRDVIPAFGDLVLQEWDLIPTSFVAKAVGFRRKSTDKPRTPGCIADYWPNYRNELSRDRFVANTLIEYVRHGRQLLHASREFHVPHRVVLDGLASAMQRQTADKEFKRNQWWQSLRRTQAANDALEVIARLLREPALDEAAWVACCTRMCTALGLDQSKQHASHFLKWDPLLHDDLSSGHLRSETNVLRHTKDARSVDIAVSTIHAVKGETHDATLVLETFERQHDLRTLLPYLSGKPPKPKKGGPGMWVTNFLKRIFVAISRPKELVCLAMHRDSVDDEQTEALVSHGWTVYKLTSAPNGK